MANNGDENVCNKLNFIACPILRLAECATRTDEMTNNKYDKLLVESVCCIVMHTCRSVVFM